MKMALNDSAKAKVYFEQKLAFTLGPMEVKHYQDRKEEFNLIDVRAPKDYEAGHVPGAISLPEAKWGTFKGLSKDKMNIFYCYSQSCHAAAQAAVFFAAHGYSVMEMEGGIEAWEGYELETESGQREDQAGESGESLAKQDASAKATEPKPEFEDGTNSETTGESPVGKDSTIDRSERPSNDRSQAA